VTLTDLADGHVEADAIRIERVGNPLRIIDSGDPGFVASGPWEAFSGPEVFGSDVHFIPPGTGANSASWVFALLPPGAYRVSATWFAHPLAATNAPFTILDGATPLATVAVNQQQAPTGFEDAGVQWLDLGVFAVSSGTLEVRLTDVLDGYVEADAIRLERIA
jgi:hypothetical protein